MLPLSSTIMALIILFSYLAQYISLQGVIAQTIVTQAPIIQASSVTIQDNKDVSTCNCDLTANSCDVGCCCDTDCGANYTCTGGTTVEVTGSEGCIGQKHILRYKLRPGMRTYFDSDKKRRCFQSDNSAVRSDFKSLVTSTQESMADLFKTQIQSFKGSLNQTKSTFNSFTQSSAYTINTPIRVFNRITSIYTNFPMPQQNSYGTCTADSNFSPLYLQPASSQCSREFQLADCQGGSSPLTIRYWQDQNILRAPTDSSSNVLTPVIIICNSSHCTAITNESTTLTGTTCNNAVRSINLKLQYDQSNNQITEASYQIYIQNQDSLPKIITQAFKISYESLTASSTNANNLSPGYLTGEKLLISQFENNVRSTNSQGFYLKGVDSNGNCNTSTISDYKRLNYGQNTIITCKNALNLVDFQAYCLNSQFRNQQIFTFIQSNLKQIGIFSTAQQSFRDDWVSVLGIETVLSSVTSSLNGTQCNNVLAGIKVSIITSKAGNIFKPQNYIVSAKVEPVTETWIFSQQQDSTQQNFLHFIDIRYGEIIPEQVENSQLTPNSWLPELPGVNKKLCQYYLIQDIFYFLRTTSKGAFLNISMCSLILLLSVQGLLNFQE